MGPNKITSVYNPVDLSDLTNKLYVDNSRISTVTSANAALDAAYVKKSGSTMTGTLDMGANKITTTFVAVDAADLSNKQYVDSVAVGGGIKRTKNNVGYIPKLVDATDNRWGLF